MLRFAENLLLHTRMTNTATNYNGETGEPDQKASPTESMEKDPIMGATSRTGPIAKAL